MNFVVTSNHIHLLVLDTGKDVIPKSMQLVAGRTAQEYNRRKKRKGAFWEDRYHAVAVETKEHLIRCLVYIDLNMVRAGAVKHPSEWPHCGYGEILNPPSRYSIIDQKALMSKCGYNSEEQFRKDYKGWLESATRDRKPLREPAWSESIAVGSKAFINNIKEKLGVKAKGRKTVEKLESCILKEPQSSYKADFSPHMDLLSLENTYCWEVDANISSS